MSDAERAEPRREQLQQTDRHSGGPPGQLPPRVHRRDWLFAWIVIIAVLVAAVLVAVLAIRARSDAASGMRINARTGVTPAHRITAEPVDAQREC
jgi:hypothetical protein